MKTITPPGTTSKVDPRTKVNNALTVTQEGERTIFIVRRHPIGLLGVYGMCGLLTIAVAVLAFVAAPQVFSGAGHAQSTGFASVVFLFVAFACAGFSFIATKIYWGNSWILTTDSVTQVTQNSLFDRESSQLSLGNLEDISAVQTGFLPHMFNYGLLKVETAGERSKFIFTFCPNPNFYAQQVLAAREAFVQGHKEGGGAELPDPNDHPAQINPAPFAHETPAPSQPTANSMPAARPPLPTANKVLNQYPSQPSFLDPDTVAPPPEIGDPS